MTQIADKLLYIKDALTKVLVIEPVLIVVLLIVVISINFLEERFKQ